MKPGDRVFVKGKGAGHVIGFERVPGHLYPRTRGATWVIVELDTGRRHTVRGDQVREADAPAA